MNQISLTQSVVAEIQTIKAKIYIYIFQSITPPNHSLSINIPKKKTVQFTKKTDKIKELS